MNESGSVEEQALLDGIVADPADDLRRLVFADWLDEHGQSARAAFIRARVTLDRKVAEFGAYADALELVRDCGYLSRPLKLPDGFEVIEPNATPDAWSVGEDATERGFPSLARFSLPNRIFPMKTWGRRVGDLFRSTPIRGLAFSWIDEHDLEAVLGSAECHDLRRVSLDDLYDDGHEYVEADQEPDYRFGELAASPVAGRIERLDVDCYLSDGSLDILVGAGFDNLRRFGSWRAEYSSPGEADALTRAPWLGRLRQLILPPAGGAFGPVSLPLLHDLGLLVNATLFAEQPLVRGVELPALRRLCLDGPDLRGAGSKSLAAMSCGELVELSIGSARMRNADLKRLLDAPWARRLEVLALDCVGVHERQIAIIADSPCASTLRILRVDCRAFPLVSRQFLDRAGDLPALTTLELLSTARYSAVLTRFLKTFDMPQLRFFRLNNVKWNPARQAAFDANPAMRNCRLVLSVTPV